MHAHLSKDLRGKLKTKKRAVLIRKGDRVKIMRGPEKGKEAKIARVNTVARKVFLEGIVVKNSKGKEMPLALEVSNLLLTGLEQTEERKKIFKEEAFKKEEKPKPAPAAQPPAPQTPKAETKAESKPAPVQTSAPEHETARHEPAKQEAPKQVDERPEPIKPSAPTGTARPHAHEQKPK